MLYAIYKATSPSGRCYIGLTKSPITERWRQHVKRSETRGDNHPLYCAIRKYGAANFTVEQIDAAPDKSAAQVLERQHIADCPKAKSYNISPGGEADGEAGARVFWDSLKANPEKRQEYLAKLSASKLACDWSDYKSLAQKALQWRAANPKRAYQMARRASRLSVKPAVSEVPADQPVRSMKERLMWKHKRAKITRVNALKLWAERTDTQRAEVGQAISRSIKAKWVEVVDPVQRSALTAAARSAIDRSVQAPAASEGLKRFWRELREDPARYAEYMLARKVSLARTNERKRVAP